MLGLSGGTLRQDAHWNDICASERQRKNKSRSSRELWINAHEVMYTKVSLEYWLITLMHFLKLRFNIILARDIEALHCQQRSAYPSPQRRDLQDILRSFFW